MIIEPIFLPIHRSPKNSPVGSQRGNRLEFSNVILLELLNWDKRSSIKFAAGSGFWDLLLMPIWDCLPLLPIGTESSPWNILSEQFFHAAKFPCGRFCAAHHAPPPNFNLTFFRPRAEIHSFGLFSCAVSNVHPYGIVANSTIQHRTVLAPTNLHPYGLYKQTTFWTLRSRVLHFSKKFY